MCCCAGDSKRLTRFFSHQITYAGNILCVCSEAFMATEFNINVNISVLQGYQHSFCYGNKDEKMDQTIKHINSSSSETDHLIMLLDKHCKTAEQLALETVAGMDMPFLNPARELTKGECLQILVSLVICVSSDYSSLCMIFLFSLRKMLRWHFNFGKDCFYVHNFEHIIHLAS